MRAEGGASQVHTYLLVESKELAVAVPHSVCNLVLSLIISCWHNLGGLDLVCLEGEETPSHTHTRVSVYAQAAEEKSAHTM